MRPSCAAAAIAGLDSSARATSTVSRAVRLATVGSGKSPSARRSSRTRCHGELLDPEPLLLAAQLVATGAQPRRLVASQLVDALPEVEAAGVVHRVSSPGYERMFALEDSSSGPA